MTDEERVEGAVIYHSPIKHSPKKRLERIVSGLVFALQQKYPLVSREEARTWVGLAICRNRQQLINQTLETSR